MNIKKMNPYRKEVCEGDYFYLALKPGGYVIGRVIHHRRVEDFVLGGYLVYFYNVVADDISEIPPHSHLDLMIPPLFVNRLGWTKGYFGHIFNKAVLPSERYLLHSFTGCYFSPTRIVDEFGNPLKIPVEPSQQYTVSNHKMVDYDISNKLGLCLDSAGVED